MKDDRFITNLDYTDTDLVNSLLNYDVEDEDKNEWYKELREDLETARWPL